MALYPTRSWTQTRIETQRKLCFLRCYDNTSSSGTVRFPAHDSINRAFVFTWWIVSSCEDTLQKSVQMTKIYVSIVLSHGVRSLLTYNLLPRHSQDSGRRSTKSCESSGNMASTGGFAIDGKDDTHWRVKLSREAPTASLEPVSA